MHGAWKEKREAEKGIKEYIQASSMGLSKKEEQDFMGGATLFAVIAGFACTIQAIEGKKKP